MATATNELTDRQQEIVALQKEGKTPPEIAKALGLSDNAIYQALRRIRERTNGASATAKAPRRSTGRSRSTSRRSTRRTPARPRPAPAASATMTPLQAIRARRQAIEGELRESEQARLATARAHVTATEAHEKLKQKHDDELRRLGKAETDLTGKPAAKKRPARKSTTSRRRKSARKPAGSTAGRSGNTGSGAKAA